MGHTVGGRIQSLRNEKHVTQLEVAEVAGISTSALRNIEYGNTEPRLKTIERLADFFGVSIDYLVRGVKSGDDNNILMYRETGLNDSSLYMLGERIDYYKNLGGLDDYVASLNTVISDGVIGLAEQIVFLNRKLTEIDKQIQTLFDETPKLKDREDIRKFTVQDIIENTEALGTLEELEEQRDMLYLRFMRRVERVFDKFVIQRDGE